MRNTAKSILTTIPAKTIMSNTFDFFFIDFTVFAKAAKEILNNTEYLCVKLANLFD